MTPNGTPAVARAAPSGQPGPDRVDWVDYAKGICIVMVVMMHSVLGVELAAGETGFMHPLVAFAKPFRMPDFFLISGLFLAVVIDRDWRTYLDRKVVHFAYFYVLWVTIQFGFKAPSFAAESSWAHAGFLYLESFIEPFGTLWFIYMLPVFFVVTKATRQAPPLLVWGIAALLEMAHIASGFSEWPLVSLLLGLAGACAIVTVGTLLARARCLEFLRFCGEHSIVIYLAFFLPMAATRTLLLRAGIIHDIGTVSLVVTFVAVVGALAIWRIALKAGVNFLFERPPAFWIAPKKPRATLQAAE
jgi:uncharacterized membrane protein YcfT